MRDFLIPYSCLFLVAEYKNPSDSFLFLDFGLRAILSVLELVTQPAFV